MKTTTLYYTVVNSGDGSAFPTFYTSKKLQEWNEENCPDPEPFCDAEGSLVIQHTGDIALPQALTPLKYLFRYFSNSYRGMQDFIEDFEIPMDDLEYVPEDPEATFTDVSVKLDGVEVARFWCGAKSRKSLVRDWRAHFGVG